MSRRYQADHLVAFAAAVLEAVGVRAEHARITAERLVEADTRGRTGHGLIRLGPYVQRIEAGGVNLSPEITVLHETPTSALIDGDNAMGQVVMTQATHLAISKAKEMGMAWVGTVHSNHAGAAGLYPAMAAAEGMIGIYMAVANANGMPPWGGIDPILGTNPIAIAIPAGDDSFELDIATTVASHGTIKVAAQSGQQMPEGWVIGKDGQAITDPTKAHEGFLMPIGGYKGSGLNMAIGLLAGTVNGAAFGKSVIDHRVMLDTPTNTGQALFVMRDDLFGAREDVEAELARQIGELRDSATVSGDPVRLPGDGSRAATADNLANGIALPETLQASLVGLAVRLDAAVSLD